MMKGTETQSLMSAADPGRVQPADFLKDLDWAKFEAAAVPLARKYNPPQLITSCTGFGARVSMCWNSLFTHRAPICAQPVIPCCCAKFMQNSVSELAQVKLSEPDDWFKKMLSVEHPNTPEILKGLFWMEDNYAPEVLLTFQDMDWVTGEQGYFQPKYSWTNDPSCIGTVCLCSNYQSTWRSAWPFKFSPNGKWININPQWIYIPDEGEKITRPDGSVVEMAQGDMIRVSFVVANDPTSGMNYQYIIRRVAYMKDGKLIKTKAYDELRRRATMEPTIGGCCGYYNCSAVGANYIFDAYEPLSDDQVLLFPPPLEVMWPGSVIPDTKTS
ncbi:unnamed protein product [Symbiodinium pilosum]|uniref:Uncharacterized protein n=1 Tax=Symbiodinium pilosum TaxID=2952 RepID=A0A812Y7W7_SYMPI|nr:unnamed protein product [Symbiodinium pilosum]